MHDSVMAFVAAQVKEHGLMSKVTLEVGSLDVNGSVRSMFSGRYVGIDMRDGPGVDIVGTADALPIGNASVEVVVSTEMLEHDPSPWLSLAEMGRVLRKGGHLIVTARGNGFGLHNEPSDFFRYMPASMPILAELAGCDIIASQEDPEVPGIFFHAIRR